MNSETLIPQVVVVTDIMKDTPDVKTFRILTPEGKKPFDHMPGQCAMISMPGVGEALFSITSVPHKYGVYGIQHKEVRMRHRLASCR